MQRAIVVDPSPIIRRVFAVILRDYGFDVRDAARGAEALQMCARIEPRLVIVDSCLPDMQSLDVLRYVRDNMPKSTHAIYCTAEFDLLDLQRAQAAGATDILVKPFDRANIAAKIDVWTAGKDDTIRPSALLRSTRAEFMRT